MRNGEKIYATGVHKKINVFFTKGSEKMAPHMLSDNGVSAKICFSLNIFYNERYYLFIIIVNTHVVVAIRIWV